MSSIYKFLEVIVKDNESFPYPVNHIRKELDHMLLSSLEFEYFIRQAHRRIKDKYGKVYSQILVYMLDSVFSNLNSDYTQEEYTEKVLELIQKLESIRICRIPKNSPDGETISAMK